MSVLEDLKFHQGPCSLPADIDRLVQHYTTNYELKRALRAEILFQKLVLHKKSPLLKVSGSALDLANRLLKFFGGPALQNLPPLLMQSSDLLPAYKRRRKEVCADGSDPGTHHDEKDCEETGALDPMDDEIDFNNFKFEFPRVGEIVAVYYEDDFFIGEVTAVLSENEADINFMEKYKSTFSYTCMFRWPHRVDCYPFSSRVVFSGNMVLAPSSSSGRTFIVEMPHNLPDRYEAFKRFLFENLL